MSSPGIVESQRRQRELDRLYSQCFDDPLFRPLLEDLQQHFGRDESMAKRDKEGRVDPSAVLVAVGSALVVSYLQRRINNGRMVG